MKSTGLTARIKFLLAMAGLGGLLYGVDFGVIATAEPYLKALGIYSDGQIGLIVGAVLLGGILSSLSAGVLCEWFGRKKMIVASAAMFLAAIPVVCLTLNDFGPLFAGRVLQGMSAGYMSVVMPMYLTETLPSDIRGRGTGIFQFFLGLGLVVAAAAGYLVAGTATIPGVVVDLVFALLVFGLVRLVVKRFVAGCLGGLANALLGAVVGLAVACAGTGLLAGVGTSWTDAEGKNPFAENSVLIRHVAGWTGGHAPARQAVR